MKKREIEITASSRDNGRIYFPATDLSFFPADSLSERSRKGHKGRTVVFRAGGRKLETDIRIYSGQRLSPRKSFAFFFRQVGAKAGGLLRVVRDTDREYSVSYLPPDA